MAPIEYFTLNNGNRIPAVSIFGTGTQWFKTDESQINETLVEQAEYALGLPGVVHIDAAQIYRTYPELGAALKKTTKPRDEIWITDKFSALTPTATEGLETSLKTLGVEYVDLYLLHSPFESNHYKVADAWKELEALYKSGKAKNIGVSNFCVEDLEKLSKTAEIKPQVNQIEYSAFLQNQTPGIYDYAQKENILLEAYSPLGPLSKAAGEQTGPFYDYLSELAAKYNQDKGLVLLRWVYQTNVLPVTTSSKTERVSQVSQIWEFKLEDKEVNKLAKLGDEHKTVRQYWTDQYSKYD